MVDISAHIQHYRKVQNMSHHELAEKLHVLRQTISK
ncbi:hypothetical protein MFLO_11395 [Listeria floridensis FSL S10-1187]|uniref:HTH cro/C1-type domain-containing protein n=1 Tax=Listeria floridensis FSL S10-1187 TaxID=1265817 RepID=A0ABN0RDS3_9LIST|nr:helix-turn-helix transcriptional regulator [Listeria floridensis]EUJ29186.1 hypothetical protein MFLO_11395 [Listeria floridensis FSL S10-1187]